MENGTILSMSIIMCVMSFTLDWNLSKLASILGWLPLHMKIKFQNNTKTRPRKIFTTLCRRISLVKFCHVRYIIKNKITQKVFHKWIKTRKT